MNLNHPNIELIATEKNWIESKAIDQLEAVKRLQGIKKVIGLPDLHPGKGIPIGSVALSRKVIYPHLIGNDIGCGMALFGLKLAHSKFKQDKVAKKLENIENFDPESLELEKPFIRLGAKDALGSLGHGNHFAEFLKVHQIVNSELFVRHGFSKKSALLLIHTGSRSYGQFILDKFIREHQAQKGLKEGTGAFSEYLNYHSDALRFARINREVCGSRIAKAAGTTIESTLVHHEHNYLSRESVDGEEVFVHRKGATSSHEVLAVIPGSRGSFTYVVKPFAKAVSGFSIAHGAGRKWKRQQAKDKLKNYTRRDLSTTALKSRVVCRDKKLIFEEAPQVYKDVEKVVADLEHFGLIEVVAVLSPLLTYKEA